MPAFSQARLKRLRAASKYSFSRTRTLGIETSEIGGWAKGRGILIEPRGKGKNGENSGPGVLVRRERGGGFGLRSGSFGPRTVQPGGATSHLWGCRAGA